MTERERYPAGVPCWVETLQPDPEAAVAFYGALFGWDFAGPGAMPGDSPGRYFVARLRDRDVAGIGSLVDRSGSRAPSWSTFIRVDSADVAAEKARVAGGSVLAEPFGALPAGRMAVLADPAGAVVCAWEAVTREGAQLVDEPQAWAMSTLLTTDPGRSKEFYGAVFGWQTEQFGPPGAQITLWRLPGYVGGTERQPVPRDVVGVMIAIDPDGSPSPAPPRWSVDFWVDDADRIADRAAGLGGRVIVPPHDIPRFRNAILADPRGAAFSVSQLVIPRQ